MSPHERRERIQVLAGTILTVAEAQRKGELPRDPSVRAAQIRELFRNRLEAAACSVTHPSWRPTQRQRESYYHRGRIVRGGPRDPMRRAASGEIMPWNKRPDRGQPGAQPRPQVRTREPRKKREQERSR